MNKESISILLLLFSAATILLSLTIIIQVKKIINELSAIILKYKVENINRKY